MIDERERLTGDLGKRMTERALQALQPGFFTGNGNYGITWDTDRWRRRMRRALEAAFDELLKEPRGAD